MKRELFLAIKIEKVSLSLVFDQMMTFSKVKRRLERAALALPITYDGLSSPFLLHFYTTYVALQLMKSRAKRHLLGGYDMA